MRSRAPSGNLFVVQYGSREPIPVGTDVGVSLTPERGVAIIPTPSEAVEARLRFRCIISESASALNRDIDIRTFRRRPRPEY